jgi:hypothetical protein
LEWLLATNQIGRVGLRFFAIFAHYNATMIQTTSDRNKELLLTEAYKRTMQRLDSQQAVAIASDQRALVAAGVAIGAAALTGGGTMELQVGQVISIGMFVLAAVAALASVLPQTIYTSGSHSKDLEKAIQKNAEFREVLSALCQLNDDYIDENERFARRRSGIFRWFIAFFFMGAVCLLLSAVEAAGWNFWGLLND